MSSTTLTTPQLRSLFDILVHTETYAEVESFKDPEAIDRYGYPFTKQSPKANKDVAPSASPLLQLLLTRIVLPVPGVKDFGPGFWSDKFRGIMKSFGEAELSESYEKGTLGTRKRLASAASVVHESITRGILGGAPRKPSADLHGHYDLKKAQDLDRAWSDGVHHLVYGNLVDGLFDRLTETPDLEGHSPVVSAAADYAIIHIATLLHHVLVLSAEGPYLLKLLEDVHKLIPYSVLGQTLRVGNAATMISGVLRLFLAKVSVGAISNWIGLTQNAADGMNLLQRIISMVLDWDGGDFRKATERIRRSNDGANDAHLAAIDQHISASRDQHTKIREKSLRENKSIIYVILESQDPAMIDTLTEVQHNECLEYYSAKLAIRDREKIIEVLCRHSPDFTTSIIRDSVAAFEPMIRTIHKQIDLRKHLTAGERFLTDFIATSKPKKDTNGQQKEGVTPPTVEDYVALLRRNRGLLYDYLHDVAKGCPDLRETWRAWARDAVKVFRRNPSADGGIDPNKRHSDSDAGMLNDALQNMFNRLPNDKKETAVRSLDAHADYLHNLEEISTTSMQDILDHMDGNKKVGSGSVSGPGIFAARWHSLLDDTPITPITPTGPIRHGRDVKNSKAIGKTDATTGSEAWDPSTISRKEEDARPQPPNVSVIVELFGPDFKRLVADISSRRQTGVNS